MRIRLHFWFMVVAMCSGCNDSVTDGPDAVGGMGHDAAIGNDTAVVEMEDSGHELDVSTEHSDGGISDARLVLDAVLNGDQSLVSPDAFTDAGTSSMPWGWTWGDCRLAHLAETLTEADRQLCHRYFRAAADTNRYGLHWIFLGHDQDTVDRYPESQIGDLNAVYGPSQMSFVTISRQRIVNPVVTEGGRGTTQFTFLDAVPDIRQHLGLESDDPQEVLNAFIERQRAVGAIRDDGQLMGRTIRLNTRWTSANYYKHIARLYPDLITVIVRDARGEKSTGSYPSRNFSGPTADVVFLTEAGALSALAHEIGHFFGLLHTHGVWDRMSGATQAWNLTLQNGVTENDWGNLRRIAGDDYESDFSDTYLPYDATDEALIAFESAQITARKVLGWGELTYTGAFETVGDDGRFIELIRAGTPPLMKNFVRTTEDGTFSGNNCGKSYVGEDRRTLRCKYGDGENEPEHIMTAEHPLVRDILLFGDSTESNLMSYISADVSDGVRRKIHLTARQRQLVRFGAAMPSRQRLRNFALE